MAWLYEVPTGHRRSSFHPSDLYLQGSPLDDGELWQSGERVSHCVSESLCE